MDKQPERDDRIEGPSWEPPGQVVTAQGLPSQDCVTVNVAHSGQSRAYVLMGGDWGLIRLYGAVSPMSLANVMKTVINSSELRREDATTAPKLSLEPQGDVDERGSHSAACDLEAGGGLAVEDVEGT